MKKLFVVLSLLLSPLAAHAGDDVLAGLHTLADSCGVVHFHSTRKGMNTYSDPVSVCPNLELKGMSAEVSLNGERLHIELQVSPDADGGDLDNMYVYDAANVLVAQKNNVAAYGNVLNALVDGHSDEFRTQQD